MQAGKLRHQVVIRQPNVTRDAYGAEIPGWSTVATVWASIESAMGQEAARAKSSEATATHTITMRYRSDLSTDFRITYGSRIFAVNAWHDPDERGAVTVVQATEVLA